MIFKSDEEWSLTSEVGVNRGTEGIYWVDDETDSVGVEGVLVNLVKINLFD